MLCSPYFLYIIAIIYAVLFPSSSIKEQLLPEEILKQTIGLANIEENRISVEKKNTPDINLT